MPLHKRKPFSLLERPEDLKPEEQVFQVRFTKEIFRDYGAYLNRLNLYRQRIWTCKITGKSNLTYEEALVSENQATEKVQKFPKELMEPVLRDVQFSMLPLRDLVSTIASKLQERLLEGTEIYGRKNNRIYPCKVVKIIDDEVDKTQYQIAWLDKDRKVTENAVVNGEDLIKKKLPFGRDVLRSFIRESTCRNVPWVLHDKLALKYGISTDPPEELRRKVFPKGGDRKRKHSGKEGENKGQRKRKKMDNDSDKDDDTHIKYPIDDLLVRPAPDDPVFTPRPPLSREFSVPMECVGDLLMVWDFCSSFSKLLNLSPFSLEYFENALCHKDSNVVLIVESHSALLRFLIKDDGDYFIAIQKKKRKSKITLITWTDYLCDFLELISNAELSTNIPTIRRGHYGLLDIRAKLGIFRELVTQVLATNIMREKLEEYIEERQALAATKRGEALEEGRKRRERKELAKAKSNGVLESRIIDSPRSNSSEPANCKQNGDVATTQKEKTLAQLKRRSENSGKKEGKTSDMDVKKLKEDAEGVKSSTSKGSKKSANCKQNGDVAKIAKEKTLAQLKHRSENRGKKQGKMSEMDVEKLKEDTELTLEGTKSSTSKGSNKLVNSEKNGTDDKRGIEQRKEYLEREMEKRFIRTTPLGKDRDYNRYWFFRKDHRIFVETSDFNQWGYYSTKDELDSLMGSLNRKGERELALKKQLEKHYNKISSEMQKRSKEAHRIEMEEEAAVRRSTRVRAPPRDNPALAFLKYVNKLKED